MTFYGQRGEYEEAEHPRGPGGQWISKGGTKEFSVEHVRSNDLTSGYKKFDGYHRPPQNMVEDATPKEWFALESYAGTSKSFSINRQLRNDSEVWGIVNDLDSLLKRTTLPENMVVYRGIKGAFAKKFFAKIKLGDSFLDKGYMSTSYDEKPFKWGEYGSYFKILADKDLHGVIVPSHLDMEQEVILARGTKLQYLGIDLDGIATFKAIQKGFKSQHIESVRGKEQSPLLDALSASGAAQANWLKDLFKRKPKAPSEPIRGQAGILDALSASGAAQAAWLKERMGKKNIKLAMPKEEDQQTTLESLHIKIKNDVNEDEALAPLKKAGFHATTLDKLPAGLREALEGNPSNATAPKNISELHSISGKAFADALKDTPGTILAGIKGHLSKIPVLYLDYEPHEAAMTTVTGNGSAAFLINTACNYAKQFADQKNTISYSAKVGNDIYNKTKDIKKATYENARLSALHEFTHLADKATGDQLTETFLMTLMTIPEIAKGNEKTLARWLQKNISPYAVTSPKEAVAESATKFFNEGSLPGPLNDWANAVLVSHGQARQRKAA